MPQPPNNMGAYKKATILPLDRKTRIETIIVFVSDDWKDLVNLCQDPRAYLKSQQFVFDELSDEYIEWELLSPATLSLRCGGNDAALAQRTASLVQDHPRIGEALKAMSDADKQSAACLADELSGLFHVEFATYTSHVDVVYFPPDEPVDPSSIVAYKNELSQPAFLTTSEGCTSAIHTDVDPSPRARAQLAVSIAQDPNWLLKKLEGLSFDHVNGKLVAPTEAIPRAEHPGKITFGAGQLMLPEGGKYAEHIDVMLTGLCNPVGGSNNCMQGTTCVRADGKVVLINARLVVYNHALFQPKLVIERTLEELGVPIPHPFGSERAGDFTFHPPAAVVSAPEAQP